LREVCSSDWTFTIVELALATGARRGELLALTWHDVDWLNSTLTVNKSLEETRAGLRVKSPKNGRSRRFAVGQSVIAALQFRQSHQTEHRRLCGAEYQELDLVLCQPNGKYLHPDLVSQVICRRMKKAGIREPVIFFPGGYPYQQYRNASATPMQTSPLGSIRMHYRKTMHARPTLGRR
jgi:integrase